MTRDSENLLLALFWSFFRVGLFTFGGGLAMLPILEREVITRRKWAEQEEILNIYGLAQSVPGIIAVNTSIFIGNRLAGLKGALFALAGITTPSIIVIITIAILLGSAPENVYVANAFAGIRAAVVGLIAAAAFRLGVKAIEDYPGLAIASSIFALNVFTNISAFLLILLGALSGLAIYLPRFAKVEGKVDKS